MESLVKIVAGNRGALMRTFRRIIWVLLLASSYASAAPSLGGVFNQASWAPAGLPNGDIAQGSMFVVTGTGMGPDAIQHAFSYPLPTNLAGTSVRVTVGGVAKDCIMLYTVAIQVAAVLPSSTPTGSGTLAVSYQGSQATIPIRVTSRSFGMFTVNQQGSGPGAFTDGISNKPKTLIDAAHAGDVLVMWGTGLGPITGDETLPPQQVDLGTGVQVFVGNKSADVAYGGRSSSAGIDQINFKVPDGLSGCYVSVVVKVGGVVSNFTSIPIAPSGQNLCSDPTGLTADDLLKLQNNGTLKIGTVALAGLGGDSATATFLQYDFLSAISSHGLSGAPSAGSCIVYDIKANTPDFSDPFPVPGLDAGTQLNLTGPNGPRTLTLDSKGSYSVKLSGGGGGGGGGGTPYLVPGSYTVNNGSGGADVGPFTATLTIPPAVNFTNLDSFNSVSRSQDQLITWSGGGQNDLVAIIGLASPPSLQGLVEFLCAERASVGQFTVPSLVFSLLPPGSSVQGLPGMALSAGVVPRLDLNRFTATGLDVGVFYSAVFGQIKVVSVQ
jgi:uncharacterized protein (TIGR03437 family)